MRYDINNFKIDDDVLNTAKIDTIKNYEIKNDKIIVHYITNEGVFNYDVLEYTEQNLDNIKYLMEWQLELFLKVEPKIIKESNRLNESINSFKLAIFGDIKKNLENVKKAKELEEMKDYLNLCKRYYDNKDILNLEFDSDPQVITANNFDNYTEQQLLLIAHKKQKIK